MTNDNIKEIINDARQLAALCEGVPADMLKCGIEGLANRLERLTCATPEAEEEKHVLKIGCQPAVYKKGDGHFTAIAHGGPTTYVMDIKRWHGRVTGQFLADNKEALSMTGNSFFRVIHCLASASNAYVRMNQHAAERKRRRRAAKKEGK